MLTYILWGHLLQAVLCKSPTEVAQIYSVLFSHSISYDFWGKKWVGLHFGRLFHKLIWSPRWSDRDPWFNFVSPTSTNDFWPNLAFELLQECVSSYLPTIPSPLKKAFVFFVIPQTFFSRQVQIVLNWLFGQSYAYSKFSYHQCHSNWHKPKSLTAINNLL
jgi:hypothetical protein